MKHALTGEGGKGSAFRDVDSDKYGSNLDRIIEQTKKLREQRIELGCINPMSALCSCPVCKQLEKEKTK